MTRDNNGMRIKLLIADMEGEPICYVENEDMAVAELIVKSCNTYRR